MTFRAILTCLVGSCIGLSAITAYADTSKDEALVVGACMVQKFRAHTPAIADDKIQKCADVDASAAPKCLGISDDEYNTTVKFCVAQLVNAKCVSAKMKVSLVDYADCDYEKDPAACYKGLGFTKDDADKMKSDCQAAAK